jgi:hypothetical protein
MNVREIWEGVLPKLHVQRIRWEEDGRETFGISPFYVLEHDGMELTFNTKTGALVHITNLLSGY